MPEADPLFLFPGLGADARMFSSLQSELPQLVTPAWIEPLRRESLIEYSRRLAKVIDPGRPFFVGGASFGGVVALEIAAVLPRVRACFVIGSIRSAHSRPWHLRLFHPVTPMLGMLPRMSPWLVRMAGRWLRSPTRGVMTQLGDADAKFLKWAAHAILTWHPSPETARVRVCQIHGERDRVFPVHMTQPDHVVSGAGHLISITHPESVVAFLRDRMAAIVSESSSPNESS